jgi:hypothetical protein
MITTAKEIIEAMKTDNEAYQEYLDYWAICYLKRHPELLQSWLDYFNEKRGV